MIVVRSDQMLINYSMSKQKDLEAEQKSSILLIPFYSKRSLKEIP